MPAAGPITRPVRVTPWVRASLWVRVLPALTVTAFDLSRSPVLPDHSDAYPGAE